jgi:DNA-binding NarL/FixJ family response regulator
MIELGLRVNAVVWGAPWLRRALAERGITSAELGAEVAVTTLDDDADLDTIKRGVTALGIPVLALVPRCDDDEHARRIVRAIELGTSAVMPMDAPICDIATALTDLVSGRVLLHPFAAELVMRGLRARAGTRSQFPITARERDVLRLLVEGLTTADIATRLGICFYTAQTHVKNIYRKLAVGSKAAATAIALRHQLI